MTFQPRREGFNAVSPYLVVDGADATIRFLTAVFDAEELRRQTRPDGSVMHAEVRIDDSVIMLGDRAPDWPPIPSHVHVYVPNVDDTYARALEVGGEPVQEPVQQGDEDKRGGVKDPGGTTWWIATTVG
ncbi:MAG: VOC family protein [Thermoanaerobaculia bacterium]|nr:VOC family protein [Thermoanaerobaculia bacterium]